MCSLWVLAEDQDVIQVHEDVLIKHVAEDVVDEGLEHSRSVGETKRHDQVFIMANRGVERRLPFVPFTDANKVVGIAEVKLGEDGGPLQQFKSR